MWISVWIQLFCSLLSKTCTHTNTTNRLLYTLSKLVVFPISIRRRYVSLCTLCSNVCLVTSIFKRRTSLHFCLAVLQPQWYQQMSRSAWWHLTLTRRFTGRNLQQEWIRSDGESWTDWWMTFQLTTRRKFSTETRSAFTTKYTSDHATAGAYNHPSVRTQASLPVLLKGSSVSDMTCHKAFHSLK